MSRPRAGERPVRLLGGRTLLGLSLRGRVARVLTLSAFLLAIVYCFAVLVLVRSDMFLDGLHVDAGDAAQQALYRDARAGLNLLIVVLVLLAVVAVVLGTSPVSRYGGPNLFYRARIRAAAGSACTPATTAVCALSDGRANRSTTDPAAPVRGSAAP